jgi:hypothetical protein
LCREEILELAIAATGPSMGQTDLRGFGFTGGDHRIAAPENDSTPKPKCVAPRFSRSAASNAARDLAPENGPGRQARPLLARVLLAALPMMPSSFASDARVTIPAPVAAARRAPASQGSHTDPALFLTSPRTYFRKYYFEIL